MEGVSGKLEGLSNPREEGVLIQIRMYDRAAYLRNFERIVRNIGSNDEQATEEISNMDTNTEKLLIISRQTCYQDLVSRADVWY